MAEAPANPVEAWTRAMRTWSETWGAAMGATAAGTPPSDPFELMRRSYDQWMARWTEVLEKNLSTPETAAAGGRALDAMLNIEKPLREQTATTMQVWLEFMNMPSRHDLLRALTQLNDANTRLDELQMQVEELSDKLDALLARDGSGPARAVARAGRTGE